MGNETGRATDPHRTEPQPDTDPNASDGTKPTCLHRRLCIHGKKGFCQWCVTRRRRIARILDELLGVERPRPIPSTFGQSDREIRRHFQARARDGWTPGEVETVLDMGQVKVSQ